MKILENTFNLFGARIQVKVINLSWRGPHVPRGFQLRREKSFFACQGDLGGPAIDTTGCHLFILVVGVFLGFYTKRKKAACPAVGERMVWATVEKSRDWIEEVLQWSFGEDFRCTKFYGDNDKDYIRCF